MAKSEMSAFLLSLCVEIRAAAQSWKDDAARNWPSSSSFDREMRRTAAADAKAIRAVATLVKSGQVLEAYKAADLLDTVVREQIPGRFWTFASNLARTPIR